MGMSRDQLERVERHVATDISSVRVETGVEARVEGRVALRGICGRVRVADMHVVSGEIHTVLHAGCDGCEGEVSCMCV
jgi:hypothetical protein